MAAYRELSNRDQEHRLMAWYTSHPREFARASLVGDETDLNARQATAAARRLMTQGRLRRLRPGTYGLPDADPCQVHTFTLQHRKAIHVGSTPMKLIVHVPRGTRDNLVVEVVED